jgi:flagellar L-ring protein precursor FlgH
MKKLLMAGAVALAVSACGTVGKLDHLGKPPSMTVANGVPTPAYEATLAQPGAEGRIPGGASQQQQPVNSASLFRSGGSGLFADQRARRLGDIITVRINIADRADLGNTTTRSRNSSENVGVASLLGLEKVLPSSLDPSKLVNGNSGSTTQGNGSVQRSERVNMTLAAIVTNVLPNGNLVIRGKQEIRVNFELRDLVITGIVRPEDVRRDNSIEHSQIAEARVSYGGRGHLTDVQQARYGQQIFDALFPF